MREEWVKQAGGLTANKSLNRSAGRSLASLMTPSFSIIAPAEPAVEQELVRAEKASGGEMGFAAIHIETGRRITLKSSERFPMASTYKLPIAIQLLTLVDEGTEQLEHIIKLEPKDIRPGGVPLTDQFKFGQSGVSVRDLLEMMLTVSDNTASDLTFV